MKSLWGVIGAALAVCAPAAPAFAQEMWESAPAVAAQNEIRAECRRMGLQARIVPDFLFSVDADGDGRDDDFLMSAAVAQCVDDVDNPQVEREVLCAANGCKQWLVLGGRNGFRLAWSGRAPTLSGVSGLRIMSRACQTDNSRCRRVLWRGNTFVDARTRRPVRR